MKPADSYRRFARWTHEGQGENAHETLLAAAKMLR